MKKFSSAVLLLAGMVLPFLSGAQGSMKKEKTVEVGGAPMYASRNIIDNAVNSKDHTTLVAAVKAAGLVETLQGKGPFTVFAPTNAAFDKLPAGTVDNLLNPSNKSMLSSLLTYHVVAGKLDVSELKKWIKKGEGKTELTTVQGGKLWIIEKDGQWWFQDAKGSKFMITISDVYQSNGVIHVIDGVLMPQ